MPFLISKDTKSSYDIRQNLYFSVFSVVNSSQVFPDYKLDSCYQTLTDNTKTQMFTFRPATITIINEFLQCHIVTTSEAMAPGWIRVQ